MTKDNGASASPTGLSSQATEPQASPPSASIPCAVGVAIALLRADLCVPIFFHGAETREWQSLTFKGERITARLGIMLPANDPKLADALAALSDADFNIEGKIIADCMAEKLERLSDGTVVTLEMLTVDE